MRTGIVLALAIIAATSRFACAGEDDPIVSHFSADYQACLQTAKAVRQIQHCNAEEIEYQEDALHRDLDALGTARPGDRNRLADEQKRWEEQMNAQCTVFSRRQGSLNSMKAQDCFRDETIKRRIELEAELPSKSP